MDNRPQETFHRALVKNIIWVSVPRFGAECFKQMFEHKLDTQEKRLNDFMRPLKPGLATG